MSEAIELKEEAPVVLEIRDNGIKAAFTNKNGNRVFKNINLASLTRIVSRDTEFDTGFLPIYGREYIGIKRYIKMGDKEILFIESSPANRDVLYNNAENGIVKDVRFPGLLMSVTCRVKPNGELAPQDTRLFATKSPILRDQDSLYDFPFANIFSDSRICWGAIRYKDGIRTLAQAGSLLDRFLSEKMNDDLYKDSKPLDKKLLDLSGAPEFPYDELKSRMSFRELVSLLKNKNIG